MQHDAVVVGGWLTSSQFLDGIALSGTLPAPLIIFATFVGYVAGSWSGALAMTLGIFLPAFSFTLIGHELFERAIARHGLRAFLDGVTAAVVGLIAVTALTVLRTAIAGLPHGTLLVAAVVLPYASHARLIVPVVVALGAAVGFLWLRA